MKILVTGAAGFIGFHTVKKLMRIMPDVQIFGIDSINDYYDINLKYGRLNELGIEKLEIEYGTTVTSKTYGNFNFIKLKLQDQDRISKLFSEHRFDYICHLAAQAGVRYSIENPQAYVDSNLKGFINLAEAAKNTCKHFVYASSSSVYGLNRNMPFSTSDNIDHPVSLYAASKKANELMAHTYSHIYGMPTTGLRFFTVYGPWGRPDMAIFIFTKAILENRAIYINNMGKMKRDFTYIDDIVNGVVKILFKKAEADASWSGDAPEPNTSSAPYRIYNIGNSKPVDLMDFVKAIEKAIGKEAIKKFREMQKGDVLATWADVSGLQKAVNYRPNTPVEQGVKQFVDWYRNYYNI